MLLIIYQLLPAPSPQRAKPGAEHAKNIGKDRLLSATKQEYSYRYLYFCTQRPFVAGKESQIYTEKTQ
jgi:hypothetical protein